MRDLEYLPLAGRGMDFGGVGNAVEVDSHVGWWFGDPEGPHIAVMRRASGSDPYALAEHLASARLPRGVPADVWHPVRVDFRQGEIHVSFGGEEIISGFRIPGFQAFAGYIGFTAATGLGYQRHLVRGFRLELPAGGGER